MATWKRTAVGIALAVIGIVSIGYVTAWASLTSCADETFQDIQTQRIRGTDMLGNKVTLTRDAVAASIAGPFLVETRYLVPYDLHGSLHFKRYVVLPWKCYVRSADVVDLVMAPAPLTWLGANNSFKPVPFRGSAQFRR